MQKAIFRYAGGQADHCQAHTPYAGVAFDSSLLTSLLLCSAARRCAHLICCSLLATAALREPNLRLKQSQADCCSTMLINSTCSLASYMVQRRDSTHTSRNLLCSRHVCCCQPLFCHRCCRPHNRASSFSTRHWTILACSAVTGAGLAEGVDWIVQDIAARIFVMA